jgi:hypothetical protein
MPRHTLSITSKDRLYIGTRQARRHSTHLPFMPHCGSLLTYTGFVDGAYERN